MQQVLGIGNYEIFIPNFKTLMINTFHRLIKIFAKIRKFYNAYGPFNNSTPLFRIKYFNGYQIFFILNKNIIWKRICPEFFISFFRDLVWTYGFFVNIFSI